MKSHIENRLVLCAICFNRTKEMRKVNKSQEEIIKLHFIPNYSVYEEAFPCALCATCRLMVAEWANGNQSRKVKTFDYKQIITCNFSTRSKSQYCACTVCNIARSKAQSNLRLSFRKTVGRPRNLNKVSNKSQTSKICTKCFTQISRGKPHRCSKKLRDENFVTIANASSPKCKEKIASCVIRQKCSSASSSVQLATSVKSSMDIVTRSTKKCNVPHGVLFSLGDISKIQRKLNISTNQTIKLASCLKKPNLTNSKFGKCKTVESDIERKLKKNHHLCDQYFAKKEEMFQETDVKGNSTFVKKTVVYCRDVENFIDMVLEKRNVASTDIQLMKIGLDGGGGFFKICLNIQSAANQNENIFKDSSVKKIFILCIVKDIKENYFNVNLLWNLLKLNELKYCYTIGTDLKLANILMGLMSHSSAHPCTWCEVDKRNLNELGKRRTLENIKVNFSNWTAKDSNPRQAKRFSNVIHEPIIQKNDDDKPVLNIIPPPELHLLLGTVNTIYNHLFKLAPEVCNVWTKMCHVQREALHGGSFTGNSCRKLLRTLDFLRDNLPLNLHKYVDCLGAFNDVVKATFGNNLAEDYKTKIYKFKNSFIDLGVNVTPKIHAVFFHVQEFCEMFQRGLGPYSEQASEAVHSDFGTVWKRYKVNDANPNFSNKILSAVTFYNTNNL